MRLRLGLSVLVALIGSLALILAPSALSASPAPSRFVLVNSSGDMSLYSSGTGLRVRQLASFSQSVWTNNGLALAPDGGSVYFTLIPHRRSGTLGLRLMRLYVETGDQAQVADGAQPSVSDDGVHLAYAAFPSGLAVRDLRDGRTRTVKLPQLGKAGNLLNAAIHWMGETTVAILPSPTLWDLIGKPPKLRWCGISQRTPVAVFVHVPPAPAPLSATCVHLTTGDAGSNVLGWNPAFPRELLDAAGSGEGSIVDQISETGQVKQALTIPDSLPMAFDRSGTHLLYLAGHQKPALVEATIKNGHALDNSWRDPLDLGAIAW